MDLIVQLQQKLNICDRRTDAAHQTISVEHTYLLAFKVTLNYPLESVLDVIMTS